MSRTSSNGFRGAVAITLVALTVICAVLFAVGALQGPKLRDVQLDAARPLSQQLRLEANQPVATVEPAQVRVTPAAPFSVVTSGNVIAVTFTAPLDWNTEYAVSISGVHSPLRQTASTFDYSFATGDAALYYLDRRGNEGEDDRIYQVGIDDTARSLVYSAPRIMDFTVTSSALAVVVHSGAGVDDLRLVDLATGIVENVLLPDQGLVSSPRVSDSGTSLGFVFTSAGDSDYSRTLFTIDLLRGRELRPTLGLDGSDLQVLEWQFVPGTETVVALDGSRSLEIVDPAGVASALPLGDYLGLGHVASDGLSVTADDGFSFVSIAIADLAETRLTAVPRGQTEPYISDAQVLRNGDVVQQVYDYGTEPSRPQGYLVRDDGIEATVLFGKIGSSQSILGFTVSPNEQYAAVEFDPNYETSHSDGYVGNARPTSVSTLIIDLSTGVVVSGYDGLALAW